MHIAASVSSYAPPDAIECVAETLKATVGADVEVAADFQAAGIDTELLAWVVALNVPAVALTEFLKLLIKDGYSIARDRIRKLRNAKDGAEGSVILRSAVWVRLDERLPDEAFMGLLDLDPSAHGVEMLIWDNGSKRWVAD